MQNHVLNLNLMLLGGHLFEKVSVTAHLLDQKLASAILVLPGLDESIADYQNFLNDLLVLFPNRSIVAIDLRGQGETLELEKKISDSKITLNDQLLIIESVLDKLFIDSVFIVGLSYGAGVALFVANRLEGVTGLALLAPYVSKGGLHELPLFNPFHQIFSRLTMPFYFDLAKSRGDLNRDIIWSRDRLDALSKLSLGIMELDTQSEAADLLDLPVGVHFLVGESDNLVSVSSVEKLHDAIAITNKTISVLPNTGHRLLINNHSICAEWLLRII